MDELKEFARLTVADIVGWLAVAITFGFFVFLYQGCFTSNNWGKAFDNGSNMFLFAVVIGGTAKVYASYKESESRKLIKTRISALGRKGGAPEE
jgi:hypothetical protein